MKADLRSPEEKILDDALAFAALDPAEKMRVLCSVKSKTDTLIATGKADIAARQTALDLSAAAALKPLKEKSRALKAEAVALLNDHRALIMGDDKRVVIAGQAIGYTWTSTVECEGTEDEAMRALDQMAADPTESEANRIIAEACLDRPLPKLNKPFIRKCGKTSLAWLRVFGLRIDREEALSIKPTATADIED